MKTILFFVVMIASTFSFAGDYSYYVKIGTGYKIDQPKYDTFMINGQEQVFISNYGSPLSARFEAGIEKGAWTVGIAHHSQWFDGWPVNHNDEYYKTELFVDYKFEWKR
jgi:hypothetical protein